MISACVGSLLTSLLGKGARLSRDFLAFACINDISDFPMDMGISNNSVFFFCLLQK